jgi:hypothetical protein
MADLAAISPTAQLWLPARIKSRADASVRPWRARTIVDSRSAKTEPEAHQQGWFDAGKRASAAGATCEAWCAVVGDMFRSLSALLVSIEGASRL